MSITMSKIYGYRLFAVKLLVLTIFLVFLGTWFCDGVSVNCTPYNLCFLAKELGFEFKGFRKSCNLWVIFSHDLDLILDLSLSDILFCLILARINSIASSLPFFPHANSFIVILLRSWIRKDLLWGICLSKSRVSFFIKPL